jgi:hypothetical protein
MRVNCSSNFRPSADADVADFDAGEQARKRRAFASRARGIDQFCGLIELERRLGGKCSND